MGVPLDVFVTIVFEWSVLPPWTVANAPIINLILTVSWLQSSLYTDGKVWAQQHLRTCATSFAPNSDLENNFFNVEESLLFMLQLRPSHENTFPVTLQAVRKTSFFRTPSVIRKSLVGENTFSVSSGSLRNKASPREQLLRVSCRCIWTPTVREHILQRTTFFSENPVSCKRRSFRRMPSPREQFLWRPHRRFRHRLFQNNFSLCSWRMRSRQCLVLKEQLLRPAASVLASWYPGHGSVGKVYHTSCQDAITILYAHSDTYHALNLSWGDTQERSKVTVKFAL